MKRLLDLFCGAGGATKGYQRVGFFVVGVDIEPQPHYCGDAFVQMDALEAMRVLLAGGYITDMTGRRWYLNDFAAIHASPPCPRFSELTRLRGKNVNHPDLLTPTIKALESSGKPFVIENVENAPLRIDLMLCGTMFGIRFPKHRIFQLSFPFVQLLPPCDHSNIYDPFHGGEDARDERRKLSELYGIDWFMTRQEVRNCIPPAYTEFIGRQLFDCLLTL